MSAPAAAPSFLPSAGLVRRVAGMAVARLAGLIRVLGHRRRVRDLLDLDDRALKDIGLLRSDVVGALAEPLHVDPSRVLLVRRVSRAASLRRRHVAVTPADPVAWPKAA